MNRVSSGSDSCKVLVAPGSERSSAGYTIAELLVALALSLFLIAAAASSYFLSKEAHRSTLGTSGIQRNARFAAGLLMKELRQAGNAGCLQSLKSRLDTSSPQYRDLAPLFDIANPVNVWKFQHSSNGRFKLPGRGDEYEVGQSPESWLDAHGFEQPDLTRGLAIDGSDIVLISRLSEPLDVVLANGNLSSSPTLALVSGRDHEIASEQQVLVVGDCVGGDMFVHGGSDGITYLTGSGELDFVRNMEFSRWSKSWGENADVRAVESSLYFVGIGVNGSPALFYIPIGSARGASELAKPIELVSGVEMISVLVGYDVDGDKIIDGYYEEAPIGNAEPLGVTVSFLFLAEQGGGDESAGLRTFDINANLKAIPSEDDFRMRYQMSSAVYFRNQGLNRSINLDR